MKIEKNDVYKIIADLKQDAVNSEKEQKEDFKKVIKESAEPELEKATKKIVFDNTLQYWNGYLDALNNVEKAIKKGGL